MSFNLSLDFIEFSISSAGSLKDYSISFSYPPNLDVNFPPLEARFSFLGFSILSSNKNSLFLFMLAGVSDDPSFAKASMSHETCLEPGSDK